MFSCNKIKVYLDGGVLCLYIFLLLSFSGIGLKSVNGQHIGVLPFPDKS
jgi:hypothetical protein